MRRQICWTERLADRTKRETRVSISGGKLKWQFKRADEPAWDYDSEPSTEDWQNLIDHAEARYRRNRMQYEDLELIRRLCP